MSLQVEVVYERYSGGVDVIASQCDSWTVDGPHFKDADQYLSHDGTNPEAPSPGYGWPLGTECWFYELEGRHDGQRIRLCATGLTRESAAKRAQAIMEADDPGRFAGAIS